MLGLPKDTPAGVFEGVLWSCAETCQSQKDAIARYGIEISVGETMRDVDELEDYEVKLVPVLSFWLIVRACPLLFVWPCVCLHLLLPLCLCSFSPCCHAFWCVLV